MTAVYLLVVLTANGCRLIPDGKKLRVQDPYGVLTDEFRDLLRKHQSDILHLLGTGVPISCNVTIPQTPATSAASQNSHHSHNPFMQPEAVDKDSGITSATSSTNLGSVPSSRNSQYSHNRSGQLDFANSANTATADRAGHPKEIASESVQLASSSTVSTPSRLAAVDYRYLTHPVEAQQAVATLLETSGIIGLDTETGGLDPLCDQIRLLQLAAEGQPVLVIDVVKIGGLQLLREVLENRLRGVAHNAVFDLGFLYQQGIRLNLECSLLAHHVLTGEMSSLEGLATTYLGLELDKSQQISDWSTPELTEEQLRYAALDAEIVRRVHEVLQSKLQRQASERVYRLMVNAQPAMVAMELAGMPFDRDAHRVLIQALTAEQEQLREQLVEALGVENPSSGPQLAGWLTTALGGPESAAYDGWPKTPKGKLSTGADDIKNGLVHLTPDHQRLIKEQLLPYKEGEKIRSAFGEKFSQHCHPVTERIHSTYKLAGTATGRMSCSRPNLQQIPRDPRFRSFFQAPNRRCFVIADYSQIELRVAAMLAGEENLLRAYREGRDTHALTAAQLLNKSLEEVTKAERQLAKAVNFGLLYGQSARGLRDYASSAYGVEMSEDEAAVYREVWFKAYRAIKAWHERTKRAARKSLSVRTPAGRVRHFTHPDTPSPQAYRDTKAFNTPVQGGAAEIMLAALGILMPRLADAGLDATPVAVVHDEIIVETDAEQAEEVARVLQESMVAGMLAVFPEASTVGLVEAQIGPSWAEK